MAFHIQFSSLKKLMIWVVFQSWVLKGNLVGEYCLNISFLCCTVSYPYVCNNKHLGGDSFREFTSTLLFIMLIMVLNI
jgi:hypothetical protein